MMKNPIGIVQGRLLPPVNGAIQAFPSDNWKDEFLIASKVGFDMIELIFDGQNNPLFKTGQAKMVVDLVSEHNLEISSVSTDFSMYHPLFGDDGDESLITICKLIDICGKVGIDRVGLSFEDNSALLSKKDVKEAIINTKKCCDIASRFDMVITIETSLHPNNIIEFIDLVDYDNLKVNFDLGNSVSCGEDPALSILHLNKYIGGVHIKDRTHLFGTTVPLGEGDVNFLNCFKSISEIGFKGPLVIQGARGYDDVNTAKRYMEFVKKTMDLI